MANVRPLPPFLSKIAEDELNENSKFIAENTKNLRNWILKHPYLKSRTDDQFLLTFLRSSKHSVERAKEKLQLFYMTRKSIPELFANRDVSDERIREVIRLGVGLVLPLPLGENGPKVQLVRPGIYDPTKYKLSEILRVGTLINDINLIEDDHVIIVGRVAIIDLANVTPGHLLQFDPAFTKKLFILGQEVSPIRQKGLHFVHLPPSFETIFNFMKSFLNEKNNSRLHAHGNNMQSLYKFVPKKYLPNEYGGEAGRIDDIITYWEQKILSYRNYFIEDSEYGMDESEYLKIHQKSTEHTETLQGLFRQLEFD